MLKICGKDRNKALENEQILIETYPTILNFYIITKY